MTPLVSWEYFYAILGTAAGSLAGLQFVSQSLIADLSVTPGEEQTGLEDTNATFATPTIVHFSSLLLLSAWMVMPWQNLASAGLSGIILGTLGVLYMIHISIRMGRQRAYKPEWEDWLYRAALPIFAYAAIFHVSFHIRTNPHYLFGIAFAALLLMVMGIHNAWDNVLYIVSMKRREAGKR